MLGSPINIDTRVTFADEMFGSKLLDAGYDELANSDRDSLLLEATGIEDVELTYIGGELLANDIGPMFEAITTKRLRLSQTMRAFIRVLNRGLNGTDIRAGTDEAGVDVDGKNTVSGAIIGKVRRVAGIPVMTALIPLSDGQTTSIIFHSPTADGPRIKNDDLLVAFQFLINKRDVTHVVAPIGGRDVKLNQVCQVLSNLIERNSGKFKAAQEKQDKLRLDIQSLESEGDKLEGERSSLIETVDQDQLRLDAAKEDYSSTYEKLRAQQSINDDLRAYLAQLKKSVTNTAPKLFTEQVRTVKKRLLDAGATSVGDAQARMEGDDIILTAPDGNAFKISVGEDGADKAATTLLKAYRDGNADTFKFVPPAPGELAENEPELIEPLHEPVASQTTGNLYALVNRPAGIGAVPEGQSGLLSRPEAGSAYHEYARHGIIVYNRRLTDEEIRQFELKYLPPESEYAEIAREFVAKGFDKYAAEYLKMSEEDKETFEKTVRSKFRKEMDNVAFPKGASEGIMMDKIINALAEKSLKEAEPEPAPAPSEVDDGAYKAIEFLKSIMSLESSDIGQLREARSQVRGAISTLQDAGRFEENENLVNEAARHLSDLLVAIQKKGEKA